MKPVLLAALLLSTSALSALAQDASTPSAATPPAAAPAETQAEPVPSEAPAAEAPAAPAEAPAAPASGVMAAIDSDDTPVISLNLMTGQVKDLQVIGADDEEIGEVNAVLGDQNGQPQAISVEIGGFLGFGGKTVILMLTDVRLDLGRLRTALTKDEIENLPDFGG
ncbi:PRC-barrel domain-containing protein [Aurantimonas sp. HBX-1]|uniref:PRC-barrel domain-containing protein n=1 Tax=Aurantimonas sp. HBX-1 TaxID=2906072 RepID=UPI001F18D13B|nr:PRC-barrel domain-containing protein [Aurantimonas sp. HBX-1]UIJ71491.1 PRC-barrel domain-containing protein [Aurantimonas sp. HBX-1]